MKAPILIAKQVTDEGMPRGIFEAVLHVHLELHYVVSTPEGFFMSRPGRRGLPEAPLMDVTHLWEGRDAWYVWVMAGELKAAMKLMPFSLPWIGFRRKIKSRPH